MSKNLPFRMTVFACETVDVRLTALSTQCKENEQGRFHLKAKNSFFYLESLSINCGNISICLYNVTSTSHRLHSLLWVSTMTTKALCDCSLHWHFTVFHFKLVGGSGAVGVNIWLCAVCAVNPPFLGDSRVSSRLTRQPLVPAADTLCQTWISVQLSL